MPCKGNLQYTLLVLENLEIASNATKNIKTSRVLGKKGYLQVLESCYIFHKEALENNTVIHVII